jgi:hypothetical protein
MDTMTRKTRTPSATASAPPSKSRRTVLRNILTLAAAPVAVTALTVSPAEAASGRIEFRIVRGGFILGFGSGSGSLFFKGNRHPIKIGGVSLGATIGLASADFVGRARNLNRPSDIEGSYRSVGAGVAAAGGGAVARLRNSRGVELEVSGKQIGFKASVDLSGLRIRLAR